MLHRDKINTPLPLCFYVEILLSEGAGYNDVIRCEPFPEVNNDTSDYELEQEVQRLAEGVRARV